MITPEEIRAKTERIYPQVVAAALRGDSDFFPQILRANLRLPSELGDAQRQVQAVRAQSKEVLGYGYSANLKSRKTRRFAEQNLPTAITFETRDDLLKFIGKTTEFRQIMRAADLVRQRRPQLGRWCLENWPRLLGAQAVLPQLLDVVEYLQVHPRPGCFLRELPLAISTKLVEENSALVAQWLDILIPDAVDFAFGRHDFEQRYGFRSADDQLWLRILDDEMLQELHCPGNELALPLATLAGLPVRDAHVILVENKINLLTLPLMTRTVALGGLGRGVTRLFRVAWLDRAPITYWGDIDVEGLQILSQVRSRWPQTRSVLMNAETLQQFRDLVVTGNAYPPALAPPTELDADEQAAFIRCRDECLRLEQERIPPAAAKDHLAGLSDTLSSSKSTASLPAHRSGA